VARAEEFSQKAAAAFPGSVHADVAKAQWSLARAQTSPKPASPEVKSALETCIATVQPHVAKDPPDARLGTLHTEAISFAKANKIPLKAEYRMVPAAGFQLSLQTPLSENWRRSGSDGEITGIGQYDARGRLLRRISLDTYDWNINYTDEVGDAGGDNVKGLARQDMKIRKKDFSTVTSTKELMKAPLNRTMPAAQSYELAGKDTHDEFLRVRVYYFKSKERPVTFELAVHEYVDMPKMDPEVQALIESISEPKSK
jgi:hypothetical protein